MKHIVSATISVMTALTLCGTLPTAPQAVRKTLAAASEDAGEAGDTVFWSLNRDTLTLSGTGATLGASLLPDDIYGCPWNRTQANQVRHIIVEEGITELGHALFARMRNLETVSLPQSLEIIDDRVFQECPALRQINLPDDVQIGSRVFEGDTALFGDAALQIVDGKYLYRYVGTAQSSVAVPESITTIGGECFYLHTELEQILLPDGLKTIADGAFSGCIRLQDIILPDTVETIGQSLFSYCASLTDITLPQTLTALPLYTFQNCTGLRSVTVGSGLEYIGDYCFSGCSALERISVHGQEAARGEFLLPESVRVLGSYAFAACAALRTIELPEACEYVLPYAFSECTALEWCILSDNLTELPEYVFYACTALEQCILPDNLSSLSAYAFEGCAALRMLDPADGFVILNGRYLCRYSGNAAVVKIPEGVTLIADEAFAYCSGIVRIVCPRSLRQIGARSFAACRNLTELELPDGLLTLGENALQECIHLTALTIPASVTEIAPQADCRLTDVFGVKGTAAEQFARDSGITFREIAESDAPPQYGADMTPDFSADIWSFGNRQEAFGDSYYLTEDDLAAVQQITDVRYYDDVWNGSCFGLALTVILAKNGLISPDALQSGARSLAEIAPTPQVQSLIHYYHAVQFSAAYLRSAGEMNQEASVLRFHRLLKAAADIRNGKSPFLLEFSRGGGMHAAVGCGLEAGDWVYGGRRYDGRILLWDSNYPEGLHDDACLYYDSTTYDYCIPAYGVVFNQNDAAGNIGGIAHFCNDLNVLNAYPHPLAARPAVGDLNGDGACSAADAVLLARLLAEDETADIAAPEQADVDADGRWTLLDLTALLYMLT